MGSRLHSQEKRRPCKDPAKLESWRPLRAVLGRIDQKEGRRQFLPPPRRLKNTVLGPSWPALGALLGALGAVLGLSWAPLGALLGHLEAVLRPRMAIGSGKAGRHKSLIFLRFLAIFDIGPSLLYFSISSFMVGHFGVILGPLGPLLGPSWALSGPS